MHESKKKDMERDLLRGDDNPIDGEKAEKEEEVHSPVGGKRTKSIWRRSNLRINSYYTPYQKKKPGYLCVFSAGRIPAPTASHQFFAFSVASPTCRASASGYQKHRSNAVCDVTAPEKPQRSKSQ